MNATRTPQTTHKPVVTEPAEIPDGTQTDGTPNRRPDGQFKDTPAEDTPVSTGGQS